jgi:carbonic anhydrase
MSCPKSTAPVNIPTTATACSLKCKYSYNYPASSLQGTNKKDYISYRLNEAQNTPVQYGDSNYEVEEFRIYQPSLHSFVGEKAPAELVIIHRNNMGSDKLLVCIPMIEKDVANDSSVMLEHVIIEVAKRANSNENTTMINLAGFTLNKFIPKKKPFIIYKGTLPYSPCINSTVNYVVFTDADAAIKITPTSMNILERIITRHNYEVKPEPKGGFFYNKDGPTLGTSMSDDIYIDCKPTGSEGEVLVPTTSAWSFSSGNMKLNMINTNSINTSIYVILGIIIMYGCIKLIQYILLFMSKASEDDNFI